MSVRGRLGAGAASSAVMAHFHSKEALVRRSVMAAVPATALLLAAGCGGGAVAASGGGGSASGGATSASTVLASSSHTVISTRSTSLGTILTDGSGRTLYMFGRDHGRRSSCTGACAANWPPLIAHGHTSVKGGAHSSDLGTIRRGRHTRQVTYNGHPLYRFSGDSAPGQTNGEGLNAFGGIWHAVSPAGRAVSKPAASTQGGSSTGSSSPYGY